MKIRLDEMGGDFAPLEVIKGAIAASNDQDVANVEIVLFGQEEEIQKVKAV